MEWKIIEKRNRSPPTPEGGGRSVPFNYSTGFETQRPQRAQMIISYIINTETTETTEDL